MNIAYYPGCSSHGTSEEYDRSTRAVCRALDITLQEIPDWSCCGSTPGHAIDHRLSAALSGRNLALAGNNGADFVVTPCPSCLSNLRTARYRMANADFMEKVRGLMDETLPQTAEELPDAFSVLQLLVQQVGLNAIKGKIVRPLKGLKLAAYYGCLMSRPAEIMQFEDPEHPMALENILTALGAEVIDFPVKTECCGASMGIPHREITSRLCGRILQTAKNYGVDALVVACPLCQMNLDLRQKQAEAAANTVFNMPVIYFTQLMGLAFGLPDSSLGLDKLCVSPAPVLAKLAANATAEQEVAS